MAVAIPDDLLESPEDIASQSRNKRKRPADDIPEDEKLEIDVNAPEPPSKKAKRLEKKREKKKDEGGKPKASGGVKAPVKEYFEGPLLRTEPVKQAEKAQRSEHGIWMGNLPWMATKDTVRNFLKDEGGIAHDDITRIHLPVPTDKTSKAQNKGFAYVDFTSDEALQQALVLSEKLIGGRRVLIKNAKSFEGRPDKPSNSNADNGPAGKVKAPAKRIFVGNLGFDVTKDELAQHFEQAGEVEDIHMATFEDSGKCKGFAWVRFKTIEAAEAAVRGYVYRKLEEHEHVEELGASNEEGEDSRNKSRTRRHKQHINRLHGRELRCEFAEDAQTRYQKRFGKSKPGGANGEPVRDRRRRQDGDEVEQVEAHGPAVHGEETLETLESEAPAASHASPLQAPRRRPDKEQRRDERRKRHDARTVAPGKALATAKRASGAIVAGAGKKVTFD